MKVGTFVTSARPSRIYPQDRLALVQVSSIVASVLVVLLYREVLFKLHCFTAVARIAYPINRYVITYLYIDGYKKSKLWMYTYMPITTEG